MTRFQLAHRRRQGQSLPGDDGFVLLESIVAISLITVIMSALGVFFLNTVAAASQQRNRTAAIQLANTAVENVRSRDGASLIVGRDLTSVTAQFNTTQATTAPVKAWLSSMDSATAVDVSAAVGSGATAAIPTSPTSQLLGKITYSTSQYLGYCYIATATGSSTDCVKTVAGSSIRYLRAVVAVSWSGAHCTIVSCAYITSTMISTASDPTFQVNQPLPAAPVVTNPGNQLNAVGDSISMQLAVQNNTGVPNFTWVATGLPAGLTASPVGLISGTPTTKTATPASVTVTVTDAFLRTASANFTWTINAALAITDPGPQSSTTASVVNLTLVATGGDGGPYTWSVPANSLPPGLILSSAGKITGTPTTVSTTSDSYTVTVKAVDTSGRTDTDTFTWTVTYVKPTVTSPGDQTSSVTTVVNLSLATSCNNGPCFYTLNAGPPGLSISSTGVVTGTVGSPAMTYAAASVTVTDAALATATSATFKWTVQAAPTISGLAANSATETANENAAIAYTCATTTCTITLGSTVPGLGLTKISGTTGNNTTLTLSVASGSGTVYIAGTTQNSAVTTGTSLAYNPTLSIADLSGGSAASTATWTAYTPPTISGLTAASSPRNTVITRTLTYTCPAGGCTVSATGIPAGTGLSAVSSGGTLSASLAVAGTSGTLYLRGTPTTAGSYPAVKVTVTDTNTAAASQSVAWTIT